ncbi:MAG: glycosyl hydrolase [Burkholderiaceae bacterium]
MTSKRQTASRQRRPRVSTLALFGIISIFSGLTQGQTTAPILNQPAARSTPFTQGQLKIGAFTGGYEPELAQRYESWLGRPGDFCVTFLTDTAFAPYTKPDGTKVTDAMTASGWLLAVWTKANRPERNMLFSVPLATKQDTSLTNVASGQYDEVFSSVARIIAHSYPNAVIRIGWEFNGDWYAWQAKGRAQDYVAAFRRVAKIFKDISPSFTIDWCPAQGRSGKMDPESAYPGDDVVDVIGMDIYNDYRWGDFKDDPVRRWNWSLNSDRNLAWQATFAALHHKPMSLPEWGVNRDDPYFIEHMHDWIVHHDYAYVAYWESDSAFQAMLSHNQYPNSASAYKRLFGSP